MRVFQKIVKDAGRLYFRSMPWRVPEPNGTFDTYKILVSEMMLQQTQVSRVVPKYNSFLSEFPTPQKLANAPLARVMVAWNGLGYNRRAKYLYDTVKALASSKKWTYTQLVSQKGVGPNTAAAVCVYARNEPHVFIETNIRSVFLHHFFKDQDSIHDKQLLPLLEQALAGQQPRQFYWSLMDLGAWMKTTHNPSRRSRSYVRQTPFKGSLRQLRGQIVRELAHQSLTEKELGMRIRDVRLTSALHALVGEGLIQYRRQRYRLPI